MLLAVRARNLQRPQGQVARTAQPGGTPEGPGTVIEGKILVQLVLVKLKPTAERSRFRLRICVIPMPPLVPPTRCAVLTLKLFVPQTKVTLRPLVVDVAATSRRPRVKTLLNPRRLRRSPLVPELSHRRPERKKRRRRRKPNGGNTGADGAPRAED